MADQRNSRSNQNHGFNGEPKALLKVSPHSSAFADVKVKLLMALPGYSIENLDVYSLSDPIRSVNFERKSRDGFIADTWLSQSTVRQVDGGVTALTRHGPNFPESGRGRQFSLSLALKSDRQGGQAKVNHEFVLAKMFVGKSIVAIESQAPQLRASQLPDGFSSFCVFSGVGNITNV